jgi:lipid II:glycine glycyltransferase (peptidoglycan interpeptide bridge formation enzyme)
LSREEWDAILSEFRDANLYQTWTYAAARWGGKNLSHLVLRDGTALVGAAQLVLVKLPVLDGGLAYVKWGPLWNRRGSDADPEIFRQLLRALRQKYAVERGFLLRVTPWEFENAELQSIAREEGFRRNVSAQQQTAVLDLTYSLDELRASLTRHWRSNLKRAESNCLEIVESSTEDLLDEFAELYRQMRERKDAGWIPPIHYLHQIQRELNPGMKAYVSLCRHQGRTVAGLVVSALGEKSFAWLAATGDAGLEVRGSYLLQWRAIQRLKSRGVRSYDLGGINEVTHPGTAQYKLGLCGKRGRVANYLGEFEACEAWTSRLVIKGTDRFRLALIRVQQFAQEHWRSRVAR